VTHLAELSRSPKWAITFIDETGSSGTMRGTIEPGTAQDVALDKLQDLSGAISAISSCIPVRLAVTYSKFFLPLTAPENEGSVSKVGTFIWETEEPEVFAVTALPGFLTSLLETDGPFSGVNIDTTQEDVSAFIEAVLDGIWSDPFAVDLSTLASAYLREES